MVEYQEAYNLVKKILISMPIDVWDEEKDSLSEPSSSYELYTPRTDGDFEGTRIIGAANIISAFNLLHQKILYENINDLDKLTSSEDIAFDMFKQILADLEKDKIIRKAPDLVRQTFKVVS